MAASYIGSGARYKHTAGTAAISSGDVVVVRTGATGMVGVAITDIAAAGTGTVQIEGVFAITKDTTTSLGVFATGDIVYWDVAAGNCNSQASANVKVGICTAAAAAADTTVTVKLIPSKA